MRPIRYDVDGVDNGDPIPLDQYISPFHVSLQVEEESGSIDATVEYTFDDVFDPAVTPDWTAHTDLTNVGGAGPTAPADATLISPVSAIRLVNADTGVARLNVLQAGTGA